MAALNRSHARLLLILILILMLILTPLHMQPLLMLPALLLLHRTCVPRTPLSAAPSCSSTCLCIAPSTLCLPFHASPPHAHSTERSPCLLPTPTLVTNVYGFPCATAVRLRLCVCE